MRRLFTEQFGGFVKTPRQSPSWTTQKLIKPETESQMSQKEHKKRQRGSVSMTDRQKHVSHWCLVIIMMVICVSSIYYCNTLHIYPEGVCFIK